MISCGWQFSSEEVSMPSLCGCAWLARCVRDLARMAAQREGATVLFIPVWSGLSSACCPAAFYSPNYLRCSRRNGKGARNARRRKAQRFFYIPLRCASAGTSATVEAQRCALPLRLCRSS